MNEFGVFTVHLAALLALYSAGASLFGVSARRWEFVASGRHAALATAGLVTLATAILLRALLARDFSVEYVASYTSTTLPLPYTVAALWGGQKGSLLFWGFVLSFCVVLVHWQNRDRHRELMPYVSATLMAITFFFLLLLVFVTPPFERFSAGAVPVEGADLNPLLQNPWMMIHPPALYLGFVIVSVPFAFAIAALASGRLGVEWIHSTRRWTLTAWLFLTLGNLLGAQWAYLELGWGGYWAWDPVENAALMPWLTATAFLHSVMIQEKKGMLKVWNMVLVILTFALTIFGTFITRSGVISSVHSFTQSGLGPFFLGFLGLVLVVSFGLLFARRGNLRPEGEFESFLSREASFLFNNLMLVGICFATFWGTIFPLISEAVRGVKITVGPPFFNQVNAPLGIVLLLLTGIGPVIAWRRATPRNLWRNFAMPVGIGCVTAVACLLWGMRSYSALASFAGAAFVMGTIVQEFARGVRARRALVGEGPLTALRHLVGKNRRRYGGYIIHAGVVMAFVGIAASSVFRLESQATVNPGETFSVGGYAFRFLSRREDHTAHFERYVADVEVSRGGRVLTTLHPEKRFYRRPRQPTTEVALRTSLTSDLYLVLGGFDPARPEVTFQAYINPLVAWLWLGGLVMLLGTGVAIVPSPAERRALAAAGVPERTRRAEV